jgi:hypothetical protein
MGIKIEFRWSDSGKGKHRIYYLNEKRWRMLRSIIDKRQMERKSLVRIDAGDGNGSPVDLIEELKQTGR